MRSQRVVTDLRHWLSNKSFVVGENSIHRFFGTKPCVCQAQKIEFKNVLSNIWLIPEINP